jgi:uncharacterized protein YcnI
VRASRGGKLALAAAALVAALVAVPASPAHVTVTPAFLAAGESGVLSFEAPNERDEPMTALALSLPDGLRVSRGDQPETPGWQLEAGGSRAVWTGGAVPAAEVVVFALRADASGEAGAVAIEAEQRYASGAVVRWTPAFTILPGAGPSQHLGRALVAAAVGVVVVVGSLLLARRLRRRE